MEAILFNFSKRLNSTKRPVDASGVTMEVYVKQNVPKGQSSAQSGTETFLSHPTLWVRGDYTQYNYMKFRGYYYFIRDIQLTINNATVIYGEIDVLATFKDDILNTTAKVIYSSSSYDLNIDDIRNQETCSNNVQENAVAFPFDINYSSGCFLLTVQGGDRMATTYILTPSELTAIATKLNTTFGTVVGQAMYEYNRGQLNLIQLFQQIGQYVPESVMQYYSSASECVLDLKWTPVALSSGAMLQHRVYLGTFDTEIDARVGSGFTRIANQFRVSIPHQDTYYSKGSRLSSYGMYIPYCGQYTINNDDIYNASELLVDLAIDCGTGDIAGSVSVASAEHQRGKFLFAFSGCCTASLMHSNYNKDMFMSALSTAAQAVVMAPSLGMGNAISKQIAKSSEVRLLSQVDKQHVVSGGNLTSAIGAASGEYIKVYSTMKRLADSKTAIKDTLGLPLYKTVLLSTLSGYCRTNNASVETNALSSFKDDINNLLDAGVYLE